MKQVSGFANKGLGLNEDSTSGDHYPYLVHCSFFFLGYVLAKQCAQGIRIISQGVCYLKSLD
jgi:hypothetical protein